MNEITGREYRRSLAPSTLNEEKETYFNNPVEHGYLVLMFQTTEESAPIMSTNTQPARINKDKTSAKRE